MSWWKVKTFKQTCMTRGSSVLSTVLVLISKFLGFHFIASSEAGILKMCFLSLKLYYFSLVELEAEEDQRDILISSRH